MSHFSRRACIVVCIGAIGVGVMYMVGSHHIRGKPDGEVNDASDVGSKAELDKSDIPSSAIAIPDKAKDADYLGSEACVECHAEISEAYKSHPMANSLWHVSDAPVVEDYDSNEFSPDGSHHYSVQKKANKVLHTERRTDSSGEIYSQSVPVDYAVGSGAQGRSYLIDRTGLLFMSPISWYRSAERWDLSPGYKLPGHRRFSRRIQAECMNCHAGRLNLDGQSDRRFGEPPFHELSIGCERCHGPGRAHVEFRREQPQNGRLDPIVNPVDLSPIRRDDICAQCHLQGRGRVPHFGCEVTDFLPGQRLEDTCTVLVDSDQRSKKTAVPVSQVEQLRMSACFRGSEGELGCVTCHDIHRPSQDIRTYRQKCLDCHGEESCGLSVVERTQREPNDSCVHCHMPSQPGEQIPHAGHTDHRILSKPSSIPRETSQGFKLPEIYDSGETRLPANVVNRARGIWLAQQAEFLTDRTLALRADQLLRSAKAQFPPDADILDALGTASAVSGRFEDSLKYWEQAIALSPDRDQTVRTRSILLHNLGRTEEARSSLDRYLELQPWDASMWGRRSHLFGQRGEWRKAIETGEMSRSIDPSIRRTYRWLVEAYKNGGRDSESARYEQLFERMNGK